MYLQSSYTYIILDPLDPLTRPPANRTEIAGGASRGCSESSAECGFSNRRCGGQGPTPTAGVWRRRGVQWGQSKPRFATLWRSWKVAEAGDCGWGPEREWWIIFAQKATCIFHSNETYPTCEMQSKCFKPLSIGVQVQDCSFEIHIWQD